MDTRGSVLFYPTHTRWKCEFGHSKKNMKNSAFPFRLALKGFRSARHYRASDKGRNDKRTSSVYCEARGRWKTKNKREEGEGKPWKNSLDVVLYFRVAHVCREYNLLRMKNETGAHNSYTKGGENASS